MRIFTFLFFSLLLSPIFAADNTGEVDGSWSTIVAPLSCDALYQITWPTDVKVGSTHEYTVQTQSGVEFSWSVVYTLRRDNKVVEVVNDREKYLRYFTAPGEVVLDVKLISSDTVNCTWLLKKSIRVYDMVFVYVGTPRVGVEWGMKTVFEENNVLYQSYESIGNAQIQTADTKIIWWSLEQSDVLVIGSQDVLSIFSDILKLHKTKPVSFSKKNIYIISDYSRSFLSKVLASSLSQLGAIRVSLITEDQFYALSTRLSTGEKVEAFGEELSYEKSKTIYTLWGFLDFLAYAGFSYQLLAFLLSITFVVLVLNILKQIIGFNVFGIYYPILFAITVVALGLSGAFVFIFIGFSSIVVVNLFTKKVHLLLHAKRALLISLYILLFLLVLGVDNYFELSLIRYALFDNPLIIFPLFVTIVIADKVFQDDIDMFSRVGVYDFLQYMIITGVIYLILQYTPLQYFLISYPDIIFLVVILNIVVGRYVGLQVFEYFRFAPLLRRVDEEE